MGQAARGARDCCRDGRTLACCTGKQRHSSLQVAASAIGGAALPAGLGLAIGTVNARILAPALLALGLAMGALYVFGSRWWGRATPPVTSRA